MTLIDELIKQEINPFDLVNIKPGNFWGEAQDSSQVITSIHQEVVQEIAAILDQVTADHRSRTILLLGDSGSGKSYLLGRLKQTFNSKAFFAYIGPWVDSHHIWRHTLRYTVDSLMQVPEGQQNSQLLLWLKSISAFTQRNLKQRILDDNFWELLQSDRQKFIKHLKQTYKQAGIYNPDIFFGVLHDLAEPDLYDLACEWLRGDDLSDESMQALKVKHCIDSEEIAKNILANFGKIANETYPIVLCFDNLDSIPKLADGTQDFQALFNINTTIHNDLLKNFLVVISAITDTWSRNRDGIKQADKARLDKTLMLKRITLDQAEAIWEYHLSSLHIRAESKPASNIFPLSRELLEKQFPGGKTIPRYAVLLGRQEYQKYKVRILPEAPRKVRKGQEKPVYPKVEELSSISEKFTEISNGAEPSSDGTKLAEFKLLWQQEYQKTQTKITKISMLLGIELVRMVQDALLALEVEEIKPKLLSGVYASYSLKYRHPQSRQMVGLVWTEDANMRTFFNVMNACQSHLNSKQCEKLCLIRMASVGQLKLAGHQIYRQIFTGAPHLHIKPTLTSVQRLATYHTFVNAALAKDLIITGKPISLEELQSLTRESKVLEQCRLLQELEIVNKVNQADLTDATVSLQPVKEYLMNLVTIQQFMGRKTLVQSVTNQFAEVESPQIDQLVDQLCQERKISIVNPTAKFEAQTVCLVV
jgi:GTPase SAR1 family protein